MKKNVFKNMCIVIISFVFFLLLAEYICYLSTQKYIKHKYTWHTYKSFDELYDYIKKEKLRKPVGLEYKDSRPILLMGCSFAYGYGLEDNQTLGFKLSSLTKRPVYNRAYELFWGLQTMLYQARRTDFYNEVPNPEYVVYVFFDDHIKRINTSFMSYNYNYPHLRYTLQKGKLEEEKYSFIYNLYLFKQYSALRLKTLSEKEQRKNFNEYFIETKNEFDKYWKDYKFIILVYNETKTYHLENNWKDLQDKGFIILPVKDIVGESMYVSKYLNPAHLHPTENAWDVITPKLVDKLKHLE